MEENRELINFNSIHNKKSIVDILINYKAIVYSIILYVAGLIIGVIIFKYSNESFINIISKLFITKQNNFFQQFINYSCLYFSAYTVTVLLGLCLIGFPILNIIPLMVGTALAIKISYYYCNFSAKGIGYSLLMIVPESALFVTILILSIVKSNSLSKNIFEIVSNKSNMTERVNLQSYLKSFVLYAFVVLLISLINASCCYFLSTIISI